MYIPAVQNALTPSYSLQPLIDSNMATAIFMRHQAYWNIRHDTFAAKTRKKSSNKEKPFRKQARVLKAMTYKNRKRLKAWSKKTGSQVNDLKQKPQTLLIASLASLGFAASTTVLGAQNYSAAVGNERAAELAMEQDRQAQINAIENPVETTLKCAKEIAPGRTRVSEQMDFVKQSDGTVRVECPEGYTPATRRIGLNPVKLSEAEKAAIEPTPASAEWYRSAKKSRKIALPLLGVSLIDDLPAGFGVWAAWRAIRKEKQQKQKTKE